MKTTKTILIVEDGDDEADLARIALGRSKTPHELIVVNDGQSALALLRSDARAPDLVILDLKLPDASGLEILAAIRGQAATSYVPVVVLSSSDEPDDVSESYRLGANSYVRKPVDFATFADVAHRIADYWLTINERADRHCT